MNFKIYVLDTYPMLNICMQITFPLCSLPFHSRNNIFWWGESFNFNVVQINLFLMVGAFNVPVIKASLSQCVQSIFLGYLLNDYCFSLHIWSWFFDRCKVGIVILFFLIQESDWFSIIYCKGHPFPLQSKNTSVRKSGDHISSPLSVVMPSLYFLNYCNFMIALKIW
jgi:hypothetical protein